MDMENIGKTIPSSLDRIRERSKLYKKREYRQLWMKVNYAIARDGHISQIGAQAYGIFTVIRTFMNKEKIAYPSLKTISHLSGCSVNTSRKGIEILIKNGWIKKIGRNKTQGKYGNTLYLILENDLIRGTNDNSFMKQPISIFDTGE